MTYLFNTIRSNCAAFCPATGLRVYASSSAHTDWKSKPPDKAYTHEINLYEPGPPSRQTTLDWQIDVTSMALTAKGDALAIADRKRTLTLFDLMDHPTIRWTSTGHQAYHHMAIRQDGNYVAGA